MNFCGKFRAKLLVFNHFLAIPPVTGPKIEKKTQLLRQKKALFVLYEECKQIILINFFILTFNEF